MKDLVEKISELTASFNKDAALRVGGNKAAGQRARVTSIELEKLFKEFRKVSVKD